METSHQFTPKPEKHEDLWQREILSMEAFQALLRELGVYPTESVSVTWSEVKRNDEGPFKMSIGWQDDKGKYFIEYTRRCLRDDGENPQHTAIFLDVYDGATGDPLYGEEITRFAQGEGWRVPEFSEEVKKYLPEGGGEIPSQESKGKDIIE